MGFSILGVALPLRLRWLLWSLEPVGGAAFPVFFFFSSWSWQLDRVVWFFYYQFDLYIWCEFCVWIKLISSIKIVKAEEELWVFSLIHFSGFFYYQFDLLRSWLPPAKGNRTWPIRIEYTRGLERKMARFSFSRYRRQCCELFVILPKDAINSERTNLMACLCKVTTDQAY
jgi:hypothetical protein